ncbi:Transcriptional regulator, AraC family [Moritella sp. JT01]|uniref:AraC family transcriptional regulator n=1 Tax=Moritella sp. JT01 TaxID=756698 RepID=UPI00079A5686|nr:GyrI-like domain-containing protein [Moritella sp. JT01]KXO07707.1 Transcriptional regulator, AraC family [Moritella sp. JT01]
MRAVEYNEERIKRVCDYINNHLDEDISLEKLSEMAICSKYHFHRIFKSFMGVSSIQFVQLARMKRASLRLATEPELSIIDIAYEAHFESPEAFSRAFRRIVKQSPSQFRDNPEWLSWRSTYQFRAPIIRKNVMDINILDFEEKKVALIEHKGNPALFPETAAKFLSWRKEISLSQPHKDKLSFGIAYNDPRDTPHSEFQFDLCVTHDGDVLDNKYGVKSGVIQGSRCAVARHYGSHENLMDTSGSLINWLLNSDEELGDLPCVLHYVKWDSDERELITDIYLPIK